MATRFSILRKGVVIAACLLAGCRTDAPRPDQKAHSDSTSQNVVDTVRVAYSPFAVNLPFFVALERGYFREEGVEVLATEMLSADAHTTALLAGRVDGTASMPTLTALLAATENYPPAFRIVLYNWLTPDRSPDGFVVRAADGIDSVADLGAGGVVTVPDVTWRTFSREIVQAAAGKAPSEVLALPAPNHLLSVSSKRVRAAYTIEPMLTLAERDSTLKVIGRGSMARYLSDPLVAGGFTISARLVQRRPRAAAGYTRALLRAAADIERDPAAARKVLPKYTPVAEPLADAVALNRYVAATPATHAEFARTISVFVRLGLLAQTVSPDSLTWTPPAR